MSTFFMFGKYSAEATTDISENRTSKATGVIEECGGTIKDIYALLGEQDLVLITEFPKLEDAMKASIEMGRITGISFNTAPALGVQEFDKLVGR